MRGAAQLNRPPARGEVFYMSVYSVTRSRDTVNTMHHTMCINHHEVFI